MFCNAMAGIVIPTLMIMEIEGIINTIKADMFTPTAPLSGKSEVSV